MGYRDEFQDQELPERDETPAELVRQIRLLVDEFQALGKYRELENILRVAQRQMEAPESVELQHQMLEVRNHLKLLAGAVAEKEPAEPIAIVKEGHWVCVSDIVEVDSREFATLQLRSNISPSVQPRALRFSVEDPFVLQSEQFKIRLVSVCISGISQLDVCHYEEKVKEDPLQNTQSTGIFGLGRLMRIEWDIIGATKNQDCQIVVYNHLQSRMRVEVEVFGEPYSPYVGPRYGFP